MSKKLSPEDQAKSERAARRAATLAALPPVPGRGGAFVLGEDGALAPDPAEPARKED